MILRRSFIAALCALTLAACQQQAAAPAAPITVLAASSLQDVMTEAGAAYTAEGHEAVVFSFAASSALAKQIEQGAPADLFISADEKWMDDVASHNLIDAASRVNLLGNTLVLVAPADSASTLAVAPDMPIAAELGKDGRLAIAAEEVPAGKYGQAALEALKVWDSVKDHLARGENVRATMAFVATGEAPLGVVYATDAKVEPKVKVLGTFPADSHSPIVYPAALIPAGAGDGAEFLAWLKSPAGRAIFEKYGFPEP